MSPREKSARAERTKAVVFLLIGLVGIVIFVGVIGTRQGVFGGAVPVYVQLRNAGGLPSGSQVWLSGVSVGRVTQVELPNPEQGNFVRIRAQISKEALARIGPSSRADLRSRGVIGDRILDITPRGPGEPSLPEGSSIPSREAADLNDLLASAAELAASARDAARELQPLVQNLRLISEKLASDHGLFAALLGDPKLRQDFTGLMNDLHHISSSLKEGEGTAGSLVTDRGLVLRSERVLASMEALIEDIRRQPKRYFSFSVF